ncbi:unnamed protein product [Thlaspi arvense]|uniref:Amino acid transporter transmembrane domain-containing protein n=1 Tax=Thlaspi arvense TaxID=13288 RepID=A0AAU9RIU1_THLAR|nr:unnamed protein product [Thlaspi arvense]
MVGAGVLGLPYTFMRTGWITGCLMLFCVAGLTYYCMMLLVRTRRKMESANGFVKVASFGDLGYAVCGPAGRFAVDVMIVLSQAGFCVSYLIFVSTTLSYLFNSSPANPNPKFLGFTFSSLYIWACFPFQLGLNSIPTLTHLAPISIFADVVDLGAMGVVMVEDLMIFSKERPVLNAFGSFSVYLYGLGVVIYSFEAIGMILPIEVEMKEKHKFGKILGLAMAFFALMFGVFGLLGYFAFGENTKDIITTNLGRGLMSTLVQLGLCINLFFTFPLMMNPVFEVIERRLCEARYCLWLRWLVVLAVTLVALLVPNFADFLSLVGSSLCVLLGYVLPASFHLLANKEDIGWSGIVVDGGIVALGLAMAIFGTWSSLKEIFATKA